VSNCPKIRLGFGKYNGCAISGIAIKNDGRDARGAVEIDPLIGRRRDDSCWKRLVDRNQIRESRRAGGGGVGGEMSSESSGGRGRIASEMGAGKGDERQ
jgi:hypothetical protein